MFVGASEIEKKSSLAPTNIVVRVHTKNYGKTRKTKGIYRKTRKPLRRREPYASFGFKITPHLRAYAPRKATLRKHVFYQYFCVYPPRETLLRKQNLLNKEAKMFPNKIKNILGLKQCFHAYVFWLLTCFQPEKTLSQQMLQHLMNCPCQK